MNRIDEVDVRILELLQAHGRIKRSRIAEEVGMSIPAVSDRMRKLEERGVLKGFHAIVDPKRLDYDITAFIRVTVDGSRHYEGFVQQAAAIDEVQEVHSITGEGSHILKVRVRNTTALERLLSQVQGWDGVHGSSTSIVLSTFKETRTVQPRTMDLRPLDEYLEESA